jgi:hypothetical protein
MFPVWDSDRDVVHEDNWMIWIDLSQCLTLDEARTAKLDTIKGVLAALESAARNLPNGSDCFVRSRW